MIIAVRKEPNGTIYIDKNLHKEVDYTQPPYNFNLIEIDNSYLDCEGDDFNEDLSFSVDKYTTRKNKEDAHEKLAELKNWFDIDYMRLEQKFRRLHTLGKTTDSGKNAYDELIQLYQKAEQNRQHIQELEAVIDS